MEPGASGQSVLLIEDDEQIGDRVSRGLQAHGHQVRWSRTGHGGLIEAQRVRPDVVLLDLGLPDLDGIDIARTLRTGDEDLVLIVLTARDTEIDIVAGLDAGADDYLTKPFSISVLLARMRAHLRRAPTAGGSPAPVAVGLLEIDPATRRCTLAGHDIDLRPKEFDLLLILASRAGTALSRRELMSNVWDEHWHGSTKTLDVTLAAVRRRLEQVLATHQLAASVAPPITTLRGYGYRLESPDPPRTGP